jgi:multisubunit Na+/H+ antiporter MnhF subunit
MAALTPWMAAILALLPPLAIPIVIACRGQTSSRLVAVQLASSITAQILVLMTFAFDQSAFLDLPLTLALLTLPGTLIMAFFLERWV